MSRAFPPGYRPLSFCRSCGRDMTSLGVFERHRTGVHAYTFAEGVAMTPPREDGRRCLDDDEMVEAGLARMTEEEMLASPRHRSRAGFGVSLWHDPAGAEAVRRVFAGRAVAAGGGLAQGTEAPTEGQGKA